MDELDVLPKMRILFALFGSVVLVGCTTTSESPPDAKPGRVRIATDIDLVRHFLDALYRPDRTTFCVIPVADRNQDLRARLHQLRRAPSPVIRVIVLSGDRPGSWSSGHSVYSYDTATGRFAATGVHKAGQDESDMLIDVRHWPSGTRLLNLSNTWIDDFKDNIFHLRKGEETFRFAIAIEPVD